MKKILFLLLTVFSLQSQAQIIHVKDPQFLGKQIYHSVTSQWKLYASTILCWFPAGNQNLKSPFITGIWDRWGGLNTKRQRNRKSAQDSLRTLSVSLSIYSAIAADLISFIRSSKLISFSKGARRALNDSVNSSECFSLFCVFRL